MPFVNIILSREATASEKETLHKEIGAIMSILPGKNIDNTLLCINDGNTMYKNGKENDGVFIDVRLFRTSPEENKKEFAAKIHSVLKNILKLGDDSCVYMNYTEMEHWASNGNYN